MLDGFIFKSSEPTALLGGLTTIMQIITTL